MGAGLRAAVDEGRWVTVAYVMLYGNGWTQRWGIAPGHEERVRSQISQVGTDTSGTLSVLDPGSGEEVTLVVAWGLVAAAVVLDGSTRTGDDGTTGQYA